MGNAIIAILLLLTFVGFIFYIFKGGNLMVGFFVMAILWAVIGLVPFDVAIKKVFAEPALNYGPTIIYIAFGSWFDRVLVDSGIAPAISQRTAKAGKKNVMLAAILVVLVTALIFISAYGVGSVIAIGVILLPIMLSLGIPRKIALPAFLMSVGAPMYLNLVLFNQIKAFFPKAEYGGKHLVFGIAAMAVQLLAVIIYLFLHRKSFDPAKANENLELVGAEESTEEVKIPWIAFIVPVVPVFMNLAFKWDAVPSLILATLLAMLLTGKMRHWKSFIDFLNDTIQTAISDIAGLIMFLMALIMFSGDAQINAARFQTLLTSILPSNIWVLALALGIAAPLALALGIAAPLALFRGPLHVWGAGAATAAVLAGAHIFPDSLLLPLMYVPSLMAVSTDLTQSWNVWALKYMKVDSRELLKQGVPVMWIVSIINVILAVLIIK
ncbi:gluconate:proton symporter [Weissella confusa]|uniref:gluconate:proton symporter n=1 Tax=Weissella confusa TaxID=1583 RepID=UPI0008FEA76D|nr:gluconate:proton symporter [Weissella confusa]OJF04271.1 gluconate:proton symporter [Weissella confusa]